MSLSRYATVAIAALLVISTSVEAQSRFFGFDGTGSETSRATNVNAGAARTSFLSNLVGVGTEDFESLSGGAPLALDFVGAGTATLSGTGEVRSVSGSGTNGFGRYPTSGSRYFETTLTQRATFSVTFSERVAAFGFYATDLGDFGSNLILEFYRDGSLIDSWQPYTTTFSVCPNVYCGGLMYIGTINTQEFDAVRFLGTSSDDAFGFDDMTVGSLEQVTISVPEPASVALVVTGLLGLVASARRRRSQV